LLFMHGWAYDASIWTALRQQLDAWPQAVWDAGYFGTAIRPVVQGPVVLVGHSLGFLRSLRYDTAAHCVARVAVNGFARFCVGSDYAQGVPPRMVDRMIARLSEQPLAVVQDFRARCGDPSLPGTTCLEPLLRDLQVLRAEDQRGVLRDQALPLLALAGGQDPIVPPAMTGACFGAAETRWLAEGGHLLPLTAPQWCAARMEEFLRALPGACNPTSSTTSAARTNADTDTDTNANAGARP
jgi:pimeloyl-[acyl-carrier protein] methyl ester esterase